MTTMKEMEAQIAALQKQVQFLLETVGKVPLQPDTNGVGCISMGITLQRLKTDGCKSLEEWLKVHDTTELIPGHCVQFTEQFEHSLVYIEYVYGWQTLQKVHNERLRYDRSESLRQWSNQKCDTEWAVLQRKDLRTCRIR